jgi:hypothetical protein
LALRGRAYNAGSCDALESLRADHLGQFDFPSEVAFDLAGILTKAERSGPLRAEVQDSDCSIGRIVTSSHRRNHCPNVCDWAQTASSPGR